MNLMMKMGLSSQFNWTKAFLTELLSQGSLERAVCQMGGQVEEGGIYWRGKEYPPYARRVVVVQSYPTGLWGGDWVRWDVLRLRNRGYGGALMGLLASAVLPAHFLWLPEGLSWGPWVQGYELVVSFSLPKLCQYELVGCEGEVWREQYYDLRQHLGHLSEMHMGNGWGIGEKIPQIFLPSGTNEGGYFFVGWVSQFLKGLIQIRYWRLLPPRPGELGLWS